MKKAFLFITILCVAIGLVAGCGSSESPRGQATQQTLPNPKPQTNAVPKEEIKTEQQQKSTDPDIIKVNYSINDLRPDPHDKKVFYGPDGRKIIKTDSGIFVDEQNRLVQVKRVSVQGVGLGRIK